MRKNIAISRLDLGYFIRPAAETGGPQPRVEPALAYLARHERGLILFDTGIGAADSETEAHYRPRRRPLQQALSAAGATLADVSLVVNCHLHFDHCGGNPLLTGKPIVVQDVELAPGQPGGIEVRPWDESLGDIARSAGTRGAWRRPSETRWSAGGR